MYVHAYMYVCVYVCIYIYIRARAGVHMHSRRRILFICTVHSLYYMRVYQRCFLTLTCVCGGGLEVGFVSACSWLALVTGVGGYVLAGVEIGGLYCRCFCFCRWCGGMCVCACILACTHAHCLENLMWAQVWDIHLYSGQNPDWPKWCTHVDHMCEQSTFVYVS